MAVQSTAALELILQLNDQMTAQLGSVRKEMSQLGGSAVQTGGILKNALSFSGGLILAQGVMAAVEAIRALSSSSLTLNANLETTTVAFTTLLGSAEAAGSYLKQLRDFASKTPFEFPELAQSAQRLIGFGFQAETVIPILRSVGDAVASLGGGANEIRRVELAFGQMKAAGRATNEELLQLAELGLPVYQILGTAFGKTTAEIRKMASDGIIPAEQAIVALAQGFDKRFGGGMSAQAQTFNGLMSTLKDNIGLALQSLGSGVFANAKAGLASLVELTGSPNFQEFARVVGTNIGNALTSLAGLLRTVLPLFSAIATQAVSWGMNIGASLAKGIAMAASLVVQALSVIGGIISSWLKPGSPPKLLPDLDKWGTEAGQVYLDGWGDADDFSSLRSLQSGIHDILKNLQAAGTIEKVDIIPTLFGSQDALRRIVTEMRTVGSVSSEAFEQLQSAMGPAAQTSMQFVQSFVELEQATRNAERAQAELNRASSYYDTILGGLRKELEAIQRSYDQQLRPINDQIAALDEQEKTIRDTQRTRELNAILADNEADAEEKALAAIELRRIEVEREQRAIERQRDSAVRSISDQIDAVELQRDAELERLESSLAAAEAIQAAAQRVHDVEKARIESTKEQNSLIQEQASLITSLQNAGGGGGGGGGIGGLGLEGLANMPSLADLVEPITDVTQAINDTKSAFQDTTQNAIAPFASSFALIQQAFEPLAPSFEILRAQLQSLFVQLADGDVSGFFTTIINAVVSFFPVFATQVNQWRTAALDWIIEAAPEAGTRMGAFIGVILAWVIDAAAKLVPLFAQLAVISVTWLVTDVLPRIPALLSAFYQFFVNALTEILAYITPSFSAIGKQFVSWLQDTVIPAIQKGMSEFARFIIDGLVRVASDITRPLGDMIASVQSMVGDWADAGSSLVSNFLEGIQGAWGRVTNFVDGALQALRDLLPGSEPKDASSPLYNLGDAGLGFATMFIDGIVDGMQRNIPLVLQQLSVLKQSTIDALTTLGREMNDISSRIFKDQADLIRDQVASWRSAFDLLGDTTDDKAQKALESAMEKQKKAIEANKNAIEKHKQAVADLHKEEKAGMVIGQKLGDIESKLSRSYLLSQSEIEKLLSEREKLTRDLEQSKQKQTSLRETVQQRDKDIDITVIGIEQSKKDISDAQRSLDMFYEKTRQLRSIVDALPAQLQKIEQEAKRFSDSQLASDYYAMRSKQILEIARLEKDMLNAKSEQEAALIKAQIAMLKQAHDLERQSFEDLAKNGGRRTAETQKAIQGFVQQYNALIEQGIRLQDEAEGKQDGERRKLQIDASRMFQEAQAMQAMIRQLFGSAMAVGIDPFKEGLKNIPRLEQSMKDLKAEAERLLLFSTGVVGTEMETSLKKDAAALIEEAKRIQAIIDVMKSAPSGATVPGQLLPPGQITPIPGFDIRPTNPQPIAPKPQDITINVDARGAVDPLALEQSVKRAVQAAMQSIASNAALRSKYSI